MHGVWEYRDIGRLFITVGGEESDNRGAEVGLWVEVILRVSLEVILRKLLRHLDSHPPGRGLSEGVVRGGRQGLYDLSLLVWYWLHLCSAWWLGGLSLVVWWPEPAGLILVALMQCLVA